MNAPAWRDVAFDAGSLCRETVRAAITAAAPDLAAAEVGVLLADDEIVARLNRTWRGEDGATNVLSFAAADPATLRRKKADGSDPPLLLGDVVIAYETVAAEAEAAGKPFDRHLRHLVVHGVLHLLGHDHDDDGEAETMEALEAFILRGFGIDDPYADGKEFAV